MTPAGETRVLDGDRCLICGAGALVEWLRFDSFRRITSDVRPWPSGGRVACCPVCGTVQKPRDPRWREDAAKIYASYSLYHQTQDDDQLVFEIASGHGEFRSPRIFHRVAALVDLPAQGRLLDIGTGRGAALRAAAEQLPGWRSVGHDIEPVNRERVAAIAGVEAVHIGAIEDAPGQFDLVSLLHVLEHAPDPLGLLRSAAAKLAPAGRILVQVPNLGRSPFDLLVADHCSHFTADTLAHCLRRAGLEVEHLADDWIPKELSVIARRATPAVVTPSPQAGAALLDRGLAWLDRTRAEAGSTAARYKLGIFGTAVSGIWLAGELPGGPAFFVDEDPGRVGRILLGQPILSPAQLTAPADVYMPYLPDTAHTIARRLARDGIRYHCPLTAP